MNLPQDLSCGCHHGCRDHRFLGVNTVVVARFNVVAVIVNAVDVVESRTTGTTVTTDPPSIESSLHRH